MTHAQGRAFDDSIHTWQARTAGETRVETDSLGPVEVPADVYWGINTAQRTDVAELIVAARLMTREDVRILMEPGRLAGEETSDPKLSRHYARTAAHPSIGA